MPSHLPPAEHTGGSPSVVTRTSEECGEGSRTMFDPQSSRRGGARTHAPTTSVGSSVSFYTVHSSAAFSPLTPCLGLEHADEDAVEECRTPTPADMFRVGDGSWGSPRADADRSSLGVCGGVGGGTDLGEVQEEDEQGGDEEGFEIKCLPNGMRRLPSPSIASRSCGHSSWASPLSEPLALAGPAPQPDQHGAVQPLLPARSADTDESDESSTTTSNTRSRPRSSMTTPRNVTPVSKPPTTTTTTPSASHSWHTRPSSFCTSASADSAWGSNFWCVVQDPLSPANTFFANPTTGECRWFLPRGTIVLPPSGEGEWWELLDEQSGREYYYHTQTRESRWVRPETGMVIPMRAVQMSRHIKRCSASEAIASHHDWLNTGGEGDLGVGKGEARLLEVGRGEDPSAVVVTPLRPRTKSLPRQRRDRTTQTSRSTLRPPPATTTAERARGEGKRAEDLAEKARRSILLSDQRALSLARKTSTPPFKPETLPAPPLYKPRRRYRPSTTGTYKPHQTRGCVSTSKTYPFLTHPRTTVGAGEEEEPVPIRKVGKGLAHDPRSRLQQRSLPFLRDAAKGDKTRPLTAIPFAITHALVNLGLDCSLHPNLDDHPHKDAKETNTNEQTQQNENDNEQGTGMGVAGEKPRRKLTRLIRFARCRATSGVSMRGGTQATKEEDGDR